MSRALRRQEAGATYHMMSRGVRKLPIFTTDEDRLMFLRILAETVRVFGWRCWAYCLMPNHYHALVVTPEPNVGKGMKRLNGLYAQNFNQRYGFRGHLFEDRYRSVDIVADEQFVTVLQYVVLNPVRSGMRRARPVAVVELPGDGRSGAGAAISRCAGGAAVVRRRPRPRTPALPKLGVLAP